MANYMVRENEKRRDFVYWKTNDKINFDILTIFLLAKIFLTEDLFFRELYKLILYIEGYRTSSPYGTLNLELHTFYLISEWDTRKKISYLPHTFFRTTNLQPNH